MTDRIPLILKFPNWPPQDQGVWLRLFDEGDMFDEAPCVHWSEGGRSKRRQGYGRWLPYMALARPESAL